MTVSFALGVQTGTPNLFLSAGLHMGFSLYFMLVPRHRGCICWSAVLYQAKRTCTTLLISLYFIYFFSNAGAMIDSFFREC